MAPIVSFETKRSPRRDASIVAIVCNGQPFIDRRSELARSNVPRGQWVISRDSASLKYFARAHSGIYYAIKSESGERHFESRLVCRDPQ